MRDALLWTCMKLKKCEKYYLAKKYDSLDELSNDNETNEEIPTETAEDIWNLIQELKLSDEKENSD